MRSCTANKGVLSAPCHTSLSIRPFSYSEVARPSVPVIAVSKACKCWRRKSGNDAAQPYYLHSHATAKCTGPCMRRTGAFTKGLYRLLYTYPSCADGCAVQLFYCPQRTQGPAMSPVLFCSVARVYRNLLIYEAYFLLQMDDKNHPLSTDFCSYVATYC